MNNRMKGLKQLLCMGALAGFAIGSASAAVVSTGADFSTWPTNAALLTGTPDGGTWERDIKSDRQLMQSFVITNELTVKRIYLPGQDYNPGGDDFTIGFYASTNAMSDFDVYSAPQIGSDIAVDVSTGSSFTGDHIMQLDLEVSEQVTLSAGSYFMMISAGASSTYVMKWDATDGSGTYTNGTAANEGSVQSFDYIMALSDSVATNFALSKTNFLSGRPVGYTIGSFSAALDGAQASYSLVAGSGDTDNSKFSIGGINSNELKVNYDFTGGGSTDGQTFSIRVKGTAGGTVIEQEFLISVTKDDALSGLLPISLSGTSFYSYATNGALVGTLSATFEGVPTNTVFSLVAGDGDADNGKFSVINTNQLVVNYDFTGANSEDGQEFSVRVQTSAGSTVNEEVFLLTVTKDDDHNGIPDSYSIVWEDDFSTDTHGRLC